MNDDKPYMYGDNPYMYDIIQICMHDTPDMNDDIPDMYEYHIHVWYHVPWGDTARTESEEIQSEQQNWYLTSRDRIILIQVIIEIH